MTVQGCAVTRLRLHHFRNYAETTLHLGPGINVLAGRNAQGKTNLLEAVATLALTRSPRAPTATDLLEWGCTRCQLEATLLRGSVTCDITARFETGDGGRTTRTLTVDGNPRQPRAVLGLCPVVLFWPEDLQLVKAGPEGRRRMLDTLLAQLDPRVGMHLARYRRVVEQRNALLHQLRIDGRGGEALHGFTEELVQHAAPIVVARMQLVASLQPLAADALDRVSGGAERLELRYVSTMDVTSADAESVTGAMTAALRRRATEEEARGLTLVGPHRDDVEIYLDGRRARHTASQGQQRSIVLACKLAEMQHVSEATGHTPVVLLDDVLSELDPARRRDLVAALADGAGQVLVTTTEPLPDVALFASARHFTVQRGMVAESAD